MKLQTALNVLASAMRDAEPPEGGDEDEGAERQVANSDVPRPLGYFSQKPAGIVANADDAPLVPRAVLLAPPKKREAA